MPVQIVNLPEDAPTTLASHNMAREAARLGLKRIVLPNSDCFFRLPERGGVYYHLNIYKKRINGDSYYIIYYHPVAARDYQQAYTRCMMTKGSNVIITSHAILKAINEMGIREMVVSSLTQKIDKE